MKMNKVLVIGSGGREHALAWRLSLSTTVKQVFVAPGNPGTEAEDKVKNVDISVCDHQSLIKFSVENEIDLVVVGPEQPLCDGLVDKMRYSGIACFGPTGKAARLEGSKAFSKKFLKKYKIPTADFSVFTDTDEAKKYLKTQNFPCVIKADGLAAGKGVVIIENQKQGNETIDDMLAGNAFGEAGHRIVIEEFLQGEEASFIVISDGENFIPMATSQDHKARDDGDKGPNTGGMGAYSPAPVVTQAVFDKTVESIIKPTLAGMKKEGSPFVGFLYAGLMIENETPKVLEFNVRFGDPETQPIMMRLESNLDELCLAAIQGGLNEIEIAWSPKPALGVVLAEKGYPEIYAKGSEIEGLQTSTEQEVKVFQAGTKKEDDKVLTNGGRVLCVCALGDDLEEAQKKAYSACEGINWKSIYYRTDIGYKALL